MKSKGFGVVKQYQNIYSTVTHLLCRKGSSFLMKCSSRKLESIFPTWRGCAFNASVKCSNNHNLHKQAQVKISIHLETMYT